MQYSFLVDIVFFGLILVQQYSSSVSVHNVYADLPLFTEIRFLHVHGCVHVLLNYKAIKLNFVE